MDALDLIAKIKMDISEYEEGLGKAKSEAEKASGGIGSAFGKVASVGGKALVGLTKATAVAVGAAATGVGALVTKSVEAYAEYEQLVGGVKKLYGNMGMSLEDYAETTGKTVDEVREDYGKLEEAQNMVLKNSQNAYKTAGMSANEYMEVATSFSASLIDSLGGDTVKAAEQTDVAMKAISDNFNTFGGDISMLQGAFQGFAKQNYTMLDNLKLGYGGTKQEMERLIQDANAWAEANGKAADLTIDSFSDVVTAIDYIQQKQNIAGTTAREATTTIAGSLGMLKSAWENLVTGISDKDADLDTLMKNVVDSLVGYTDEAGEHVNGFIDNIIPVIETALKSVGTMIQKIVPEALKLLPSLLNDVIPSLIQAGLSLVSGITNAIRSGLGDLTQQILKWVPVFIQNFAMVIPQIIEIAGDIIRALILGISQNIGMLSKGAVNIVKTFITTIIGLLPDLLEVGLKMIEELATAISDAIPELIPVIVEVVKEIATMLVDHLPELLTAGMQIVLALAQGILDAIPDIIAVLPELIQGIVDGLVEFLPELTEAWVELMNCFEMALPEIVDAILQALPQIMDTIVNYWLGDGAKQTFRASVIMFGSLTKALLQVAANVIASVGMFVRNIGSTIAGEAGNMLTAATTMFNGVLSGAKTILNNLLSAVKTAINNAVSAVRNVASQMYSAGANLITGLYNGIKDKMAWVVNLVGSLAQSIINKARSAFKEKSPSRVFYEIGDYLGVGLGMGWEDSVEKVNKQIDKDLHYKGEIDVTAKTGMTSVGTVAGSSASLSESDIDKLLSNLSITLYNTTEIDGHAIDKRSYKYTVTRLGDETRAVRVSMGG